MNMDQLKAGNFLIASPDFREGFFIRAVVLLCEHTDKTSFGLVINKVLDVELPEDMVNIQHLINPHVGYRAGGPVQTNQMMLLHTANPPPERSVKLLEGVNLGGDLQFLQTAMADENGPYVYLCFGYAGWSQGQLEKEYQDGRWVARPATEEHVFHTPPEKLWQQLLMEMGGRYASLSTIPEDLSVN